MRAVISRVSSASVSVGGERVSQIGRGLLVLLGVTPSDTQREVELTARKIADLRVFDGETEMSVTEVGGEVLVVSQFTLYGDVRKGRRPSWTTAAPGEVAEPLYEAVAERLRTVHGLPVKTGIFGAMMAVESVNDGPFTLWWEC
ncbi:D-tyrosyl-tRNA(Tyr) deacylase [Flaviflexus salsibiostraticola]|uniref:D-aminoacyl-tRNA deacylase n=1 Tax=Flaviflexus salsibiostraticola TaxID=1282737 RepID=A0A3Q8WTN8_9ACTO|nr:D-aminoacyl-tRNA deacylase [Flaviflexus salsibiostraticola]AZN30063.1 D-tyrosyl-tRNA(Tyr) deacylase [Flaviflexus salsibiostraticola]